MSRVERIESTTPNHHVRILSALREPDISGHSELEPSTEGALRDPCSVDWRSSWERMNSRPRLREDMLARSLPPARPEE